MGYMVKVAELYLNNDENRKEFTNVIGLVEAGGYKIVHVDDNTIEIIKEMEEE